MTTFSLKVMGLVILFVSWIPSIVCILITTDYKWLKTFWSRMFHKLKENDVMYVYEVLPTECIISCFKIYDIEINRARNIWFFRKNIILSSENSYIKDIFRGRLDVANYDKIVKKRTYNWSEKTTITFYITRNKELFYKFIETNLN